MAEQSAEGGVVAVIVLDESEEEGYDPEAAAIRMTPLPLAAAADPTENLFTQEGGPTKQSEDDGDGDALRRRHDVEEEGDAEDEELMTWPYRRRKPPVPSIVPSSSSSSSSTHVMVSANGRKEDEEEQEDHAQMTDCACLSSESLQTLSAAMTTRTMPSSPSTTTCTMEMTSGSFPPIDEDALLNDLFGEKTDRCSLDKQPNREGKKLKRSLAIEEENDETVERKRTKKEEELKKGKKSRLKLRGSRERSVNPKIKPLKIIGGEPKLSKSASAGQLEQVKEHEQRAGAPPVRHGDDLTEQTAKLVMRKSREERSAVDGDGEDSSLNDSIESVEGEECPLCGERFGADELQAHVESELESQERHRAAGSAAVPPPTPASEESHRPITRSMARRGSKPTGIEVVVIDDDEAEEDDVVIDDSGMAECPFCQQRLAAGAEIEQHVQHEIALREGRTHTSPRSITVQPTDNSKRANAAGGQPRKRARLPLVPPQQSKEPRKLPASFGPLDDDDDEEQEPRTKGSCGLTGTLSPFIRRTMNVGAASASSFSTSSSSTSVTWPRATGAPQPSGGTSGSDANGEDNGEGEEEDNYDDVTFNFRPLWSASTQEMPYDYQNQFTKQKKKRGRKKAQVPDEEEEEADLGGGHDVVDLDADDDVVEVGGPSKRVRKRKEGGTTSRSRGKSSTTTTAKRKSGWRGRRGWHRGRAKR